MKSYHSLVPVSARIHKRQSRMTRICIVLAVFLVTSVFSMADMWIRAEKKAMINKHGDYHIILRDVQSDKAEQIRQRTDVAVSSEYRAIKSDEKESYYINGKNTVLYGVEETYLTDIMNYPTEGSYPANDKEIALSADAKELFGIHVGDAITLNTPSGDFDFVVSAFYEDDTEYNHIIDGSCAYMNISALQTVSNLNGKDISPEYYIQFTENTNVKKMIADIKEQCGLAEENIDENTAVLGLTGASSNEAIKNIYPLAIACFSLILISGILMISSCMNSNVAQRTSFFGMMRCIGASKQQIVRFVRLEALNWCKTAIPIGCALGTVICWILCAILRFLVKGEWVDMPLFAVSISGILSGAAVGIITVFIAAHSPAKQAADVSPVAAVSGNAEISKHVVHAAKARLFKVETSLGIHHATGAKKNLLLMTGSFALMIILFLAFSACLDLVHKLLPSVTGKFTPDITIASKEDTNSIDGNLPREIAQIPGVESVFGMMTRIAYPVWVNGNEQNIDLVSHDKTLLDTFRKSIISGDISKVYEDGNYAMAVYNQDNRLNVGDKIKIENQELEIVCITSEGIGSISGSASVVCSEQTFMRLLGEDRYTTVSVVLGKEASDAAVSKIHDLSGDYFFADNREENDDVNGSYWVFRLAAYGFLGIISLITVLNIMNSISMGVSSRIKQYGVMRAVGMESRQVTKMIAAEAVTYAASGAITGIIFGLLLHYLIYAKIIISHFGGAWKIPVTPIAIILLLVSASCVAAVYTPARRIRNMEITATINEL